jgi:hypothetical protein
MNKKKDLGQFFTTNVGYILNDFESHVVNKHINDPFAGGGDLLSWANQNGALSATGYDIDENLVGPSILLNDSLKFIPKSSFIMTNPPYLAKNKMSSEMKEKYLADNGLEDLYLLAMKRILESGVPEGIIIVPVNFFSADNSNSLRKQFLSTYRVSKVNLFTQQVFSDTTYNVVAFYFSLSNEDIQEVTFSIHPNGPVKTFTLEKCFNYKIAGRELSPIIKSKNILRPTRITEAYFGDGDVQVECFFNDTGTAVTLNTTRDKANILSNNIILLNCIDTNTTQSSWINATDIRTLGKTCLVGKHSSRNAASVIVNGISIQEQEKLIIKFNDTLNQLRHEYNSLFLTNFRDNNRKRVGFDFCYQLLNYCYFQLVKS